MADSATGKISIGHLIFWPAVITLIVTILRLEGELHHWGALWFNNAAGGGGAVVGISWLPILFGPYFALKLAGSGDGPATFGKAFGATLGGFAVLILGSALLVTTQANPGLLTLGGFVILLASGFIPGLGWRQLGCALLSYAFAARIPVLIVMYFAMSGNWGTHYDAVPHSLQNAELWKKFLEAAFLPQMFLWIGYTVVIGSLFGEVAAVLARRGPAATNS